MKKIASWLLVAVLLLVASPAFAAADNAAQCLADGKAAAAAKEYDKAIAAFGDALRLAPELNEAVVERGKVYLSTKQFALAQADFTAALAQQPNNELLHWFRGLAYAGQDKDQAAVDAYSEALRLNPKLAIAYWTSGRSLERMGFVARAQQAYTAYLQVAPTNDPLREKVKERLAELEKADKSRVAASNDADRALNEALAKKNVIVVDYFATDYLTLTLDKPRWTVGYKEGGENVSIELVTGQETVKNWTELITVQFLRNPQNMTVEQYVSNLEQRYRGMFGDKLSFKRLKSTEQEAVIEYRIAGQPGLPDEHTITRIFKGKVCLGFIHYAVRPAMTEQQRAAALKIIETAVHSDKLPK